MELQAAVAVLRRRWWLLIAGVVLGLVASMAATAGTPKSYRASSRLFVSIPSAGSVRDAVDGVVLSTQLLQSYAKVVDSQSTANLIRERLTDPPSVDLIQDKVSARPLLGTLLIEVYASDRSPKRAVEYADAAAKALTIVIGNFDPTSTGSRIRATVIDRAELPTSPISPQPVRNVGAGLLVGLALGVAAAVALDAFDRSIKDPTTAADVFDAPYLGSVPKQRRLSLAPLAVLKPQSSAGESYRVLRTAIRFRDSSEPISTVLITSVAAGDGKSTIAANLALTMGQDGARVVLIDGDLRRSKLDSLFDLPKGPGLTDALLGKVTLDEALVPYGRGVRILRVGETELNPSEALGSQAMVDLLDEARKTADIVIIDAPPVLPVADATVLAALVDGTVVVCRWGHTSLHAATVTRKTLENVGADVIGVVINAEGGGSNANYYRHYSNSRWRFWGRKREHEQNTGLVPAAPREDRRSASPERPPAHMRPGA